MSRPDRSSYCTKRRGRGPSRRNADDEIRIALRRHQGAGQAMGLNARSPEGGGLRPHQPMVRQIREQDHRRPRAPARADGDHGQVQQRQSGRHGRTLHRGQGSDRRLCRGRCRRPGRGDHDGEGMADRRARRSPSGGRSGRAAAITGSKSATDAALTAIFREETGRLTAALVRALGDFDLAEELVQEALLEAVEHWPKDGIPDKPGAWLLTTARRKAVDQFRRQARFRDKLALLEGASMRDDTAEGDDRLRLIFTCCHPALSREAQVALTLRAVAGLTTMEIARAFITNEATIAQRIVRAKRKIVDANIPYRLPAERDLAERLDEVLAVLYLMFNEGYLATAGDRGSRRDRAEDAAWLAGLMVRLMPEEPKALGLLALMRLHLARADSRFDPQGDLVLLQDQDRSRWDQ